MERDSAGDGAEETTMTTNTTVQAAINDSIRQNEIVHLTIHELDSSYEPVIAELESISEDWAAAGELEFWGVDEDGDEWRIHVERRD